jgi:uncharacterized protein YqgV (UPF0045/DUF77 family)
MDDLTNLPTPPACIADFCIIPLGTPTASVSSEVAQVQRLLKKSGLSYSMHSAGTTVGTSRPRFNPPFTIPICTYIPFLGKLRGLISATEGSWDDVMRVIGQCHALLHQNGVVRIQSDIRVGSRTDKKQGMKDKVEKVERLLEGDA